MRVTSADVKLFHSRYEIQSNGCWLWTGRIDGGYGAFSFGRGASRMCDLKAHRFAYLWFYGELPEKLFICHKCNVPRCVNPLHLYAGTPQENSNDQRARHYAKYGCKPK